MLHQRRIISLSLTLLVAVPGFIAIDDGLPADATGLAGYSAVDTPRFRIALDRERLTLDGYTASLRQEQGLLRSADRLFADMPRNVRFKPLGPAPDFWASASIALLETLTATRSAHALLTDQTVGIRGVATSGWDRGLLALRAALPASIEIDVDMIIAPDNVSARQLCARAFANFQSDAINFEESTTELRSSAKPALDRAVSLADACRQSIVTITGHTDSSGPETSNLLLSLERARAVADYLASSGIARERLATVGAGSSQPLVSNASRYGRSLNRRIEIDFEQDPIRPER